MWGKVGKLKCYTYKTLSPYIEGKLQLNYRQHNIIVCNSYM